MAGLAYNRCSKFLADTQIIRQATSTYSTGKDFEFWVKEVATNDDQRLALVKHFLFFNTPFLFSKLPILYQQICNYLAYQLKVYPHDILLIGSAKTGFSMSKDEFGREFNNGDLDFTIIDQSLFEKLANEFNYVSEALISGKYALPGGEEKYWPINQKQLPENIKNGFIDPHKIPVITISTKTSHIQSSLKPLKENLKMIWNIETKGASVRIYKNWNCFIKQQLINLNWALGIRINTQEIIDKYFNEVQTAISNK